MRGVARSSWPSRPRRSSRSCHPRPRAKRCATALPMPWSGAARAVARGHRGALFYVGFLAGGFVLGGVLHALLRRFLPQGAAKEFFTTAVTPTFGPVHLDLLVGSVTLGPIGFDVSLLAVVGVAIAYFVARSIF